MEIKTKYEIGQRVWVALKNETNKEVEVFSDIIYSILVERGNKVVYILDTLCNEVEEKDMFHYEETDKLMLKIITYDNDLNKGGNK